MQKPLSNLAKRIGPLMVGCILTALAPYAWADTALSNNPLYSSSNVPANLMMALSVEYPTGTVAAYGSATGYSPSSTYLGYFDPAKCYSYSTSSPPGSTTAGYFVPAFTVSIGATCANKSGSQTNYYWSGNFLNWATMTSLDEFRQAMTGGQPYRRYEFIDGA